VAEQHSHRLEVLGIEKLILGSILENFARRNLRLAKIITVMIRRGNLEMRRSKRHIVVHTIRIYEHLGLPNHSSNHRTAARTLLAKTLRIRSIFLQCIKELAMTNPQVITKLGDIKSCKKARTLTDPLIRHNIVTGLHARLGAALKQRAPNKKGNFSALVVDNLDMNYGLAR